MPEQNFAFDATPSWSGYNYQGKVALYVVLDKICELYLTEKVEEISDFFLELEWIEDFSIINRTADCNAYKSIHQVKALDKSEINDYGEAVLGLSAKLLEYNTIEAAYLHTWKPINVIDVNWISELKDLIEKTRKEANLVTEMENLLIDNTALTVIIKRIITPRSGPVPNIIKRITAYELDVINEENVKAAIVSALQFAKQDSEEFSAKLTDECLIKIKLFDYNGSNYCDLDDIRDKILDKISEHLVMQGEDWRIADRNYKETIYHYLMGEIDKNIIIRHKLISQKDKLTIPFSKFENILCNQNLSNRSKEYYLFHLKNKLLNMYNDYCKCCSKKSKDVCQSCGVLLKIEDIKSMDMEMFEKLCRILCPDVKGKLDEINVFHSMLEANGINACFFRALREIKKENEVKNKMISFVSPENKTLLLTALANKGTDFNSSFVCMNIIENKEIDDVFMDIDELVSKDFDEDSIWECARKITNIDDGLENDVNSSDHIFNCKRVSIRAIEDVIRRFEN